MSIVNCQLSTKKIIHERNENPTHTIFTVAPWLHSLGATALPESGRLPRKSGGLQPDIETTKTKDIGQFGGAKDSPYRFPAENRRKCRRYPEHERPQCLERAGGGVFVVSQPLYTGGALNAQHQIAKADEKLNQLNEELTLDQIHYQSDAVYWNASASKAMLQAADKYQSIVKQQYDIIQDRFDDGMISRTDLLMISTRLKEAELQYIKARQNYTLALQQLNILMGAAPNAPVDSLYSIGMISAPVRILPLEDVLQRRADYASTEVNIMKSQAQRKAALSQFNPQLNMYFSGGWATGTPNLGYDVSFNPIVGVNLNIPIFRWGARFKTNRQQKAYIGIQKLQQSYMTDNINEELSAALTKLTETESQVKTAKENMSLANENLDLATFSYNEGKASMVDVLSAQLSWTQAHTNLINAYLAEKMAVAEYKKVTSE